ncbi:MULTISPECIES: hypothetical protein [unclassified Streptomyces]|uniref:hypothetical protein n=1 Tax=unclassified Streptomyces TaxID=2593676 RepID=UPI0005AAFEBC|nr:hypothetical protein [Streptomyces sp. NBC_00370]
MDRDTNTDDEQRLRGALLSRISSEIADKGWARCPASTPEERTLLREVGRALSERWGRVVQVEAEDACSMLFRDLPG